MIRSSVPWPRTSAVVSESARVTNLGLSNRMSSRKNSFLEQRDLGEVPVS